MVTVDIFVLQAASFSVSAAADGAWRELPFPFHVEDYLIAGRVHCTRL